MAERVAIVVGVAGLIAASWACVGLWRRHMLRKLRTEQPFAAVVPLGRPAVVAFSTPSCRECHTRQQPALAQLSELEGDAVTIRSISALEHPDLVRKLGILTVPSTIVVDRQGAVRYLNLGYTSAARLHEQLLDLRTIRQ